jgi:hypothetical protein
MPLTITATESGGFANHEEGDWYPGQLTRIEETDSDWGPGLKWVVTIDGEVADNGETIETWAYCSQKLSPRSKLYAWLKGFGITPEPGEHVDLEDLVGKRVEVMFEEYAGTDNDGNPVTKEKVVKIRASKTAPVKAVPAPVDDDEAPF